MTELTPEEKQRANKVLIPIIIIMMVAGCGACFWGGDDEAAPPPPEPVVVVPLTRWQQFVANHCDTIWSGACYPVQSAIKRLLNDRSSYEHVETLYLPNDDTSEITVTTTFRAKNGFGAMMLATYTARVDINGNVLEIKEAQ